MGRSPEHNYLRCRIAARNAGASGTTQVKRAFEMRFNLTFEGKGLICFAT